MTPRFKLQGALGLMLLAQTLGAQPARGADDAAAPDGQGTEDAAGSVSLQLFEFLGEFTTEDGEWVDPAVLMEADLAGSAGTEMGARGADDGESDPIENCLDPECEK